MRRVPKLFGQYLVERGLINEEQLAEMLMEQLRAMPSIPEIIYQEKLLALPDLLSALAHHANDKISFITACERMGIWSEKISSEVERKLKAFRIPLGQLLLKHGLVDFEQINLALDSFLREQGSLGGVIHLELEIEETPISLELRLAYQDLLEQIPADRLRTLVKKLEQGYEPEAFKSLLGDLRRIRGAARFIGTPAAESFLGCIEDVLGEAAGAATSVQWPPFMAEVQRSIQLYMELSSALIQAKSLEETSSLFPKIQSNVEKLRAMLGGSHGSSEPTSVSGFRILIIDDSKAVHRFVRDSLKVTSITVESASNGNEGLEALKARDFDLVLLDWEMPVKNGPETLVEIVSFKPQLPVVMMTSRNSVDDITQMLEKGAREYIMKPFTEDILIGKIESIIGSLQPALKNAA